MAQSAFLVVVFVVVLALFPLALKWLQKRNGIGGAAAGLGVASKVVSAVAVGPQQRVVTVEVGPEGARTWLVLGVTGQTITCLHTMPAAGAAATTVVTPATPSFASLLPRADDGENRG